ncbi:MAG: ubiquinol-cytochrome c reductase iron-sulfur subunit [Planctomycetota bacterium]
MSDEKQEAAGESTPESTESTAVKRPKLVPVRQAAAKKPAAAPQKEDEGITRRGLFSALGFGWLAFVAASGAALTAGTRFLFPNVRYEPPTSFRVGFPTDYTIGAVEERYKAAYGVWIVRNEEGMYALSTVCTHLGCTPNWLAAEQKFKCPCHGSGFRISGINFEGPAPRPLERYAISLADDGQVLVDKSRLFQEEKGQWKDPASFLRL